MKDQDRKLKNAIVFFLTMEGFLTRWQESQTGIFVASNMIAKYRKAHKAMDEQRAAK